MQDNNASKPSVQQDSSPFEVILALILIGGAGWLLLTAASFLIDVILGLSLTTVIAIGWSVHLFRQRAKQVEGIKAATTALREERLRGTTGMAAATTAAAGLGILSDTGAPGTAGAARDSIRSMSMQMAAGDQADAVRASVLDMNDRATSQAVLHDSARADWDAGNAVDYGADTAGGLLTAAGDNAFSGLL